MFCGGTHVSECWCRICCMQRGVRLKTAYRITRAIAQRLRSGKESDLISKPLPGKLLGGGECPWDDPSFAESYPQLASHLRDMTYDDGSQRATSTLLVFCDAGALKLCLNDRDNNRSAFVSKSTLAEGLATLEKGLREGSLEWRRRGDYNNKPMVTPF